MSGFSELVSFDRKELFLFSDIIVSLRENSDNYSARQQIVGKVTELLHADFGSSYVWNDKEKRSANGVVWNVDERARKEFEDVWQYHDPITRLLRKRACPTTVNEVIPERVFHRSSFWNEYLSHYNMAYGINVFFFRNGKDVGDLRIWRTPERGDFGDRERVILDVLSTYINDSLPGLTGAEELTPRENEIASLVSKGLSDKEISRCLDIGFTTVRTHINNSLRKLQCSNRTELAARLTFR